MIFPKLKSYCWGSILHLILIIGPYTLYFVLTVIYLWKDCSSGVKVVPMEVTLDTSRSGLVKINSVPQAAVIYASSRDLTLQGVLKQGVIKTYMQVSVTQGKDVVSCACSHNAKLKGYRHVFLQLLITCRSIRFYIMCISTTKLILAMLQNLQVC